jgi:hypothetical protein
MKARFEELAIAWRLTDTGLREMLNSSKGVQEQSTASLSTRQHWQRLTFEARPSQPTLILFTDNSKYGDGKSRRHHDNGSGDHRKPLLARNHLPSAQLVTSNTDSFKIPRISTSIYLEHHQSETSHQTPKPSISLYLLN